MPAQNASLEVLETRTLMSATGAVFDPTVAVDRLEVRADLLKFRADLASSSAAMLADMTAIRANSPGALSTLTPLITKYRTDQKTMNTALRSDLLNESIATVTDELAILKVRLQKLHDRGNDTALAADNTQLQADRVQLQTDLIAGLNSRIATRQADETAIFNDVTAIVTAVQSDTAASPALVTAVEKLAADKTARLNTVNADLATLLAARTKLATDLAND
jgi:hypothetical protein